jgi:hypothetical protein
MTYADAVQSWRDFYMTAGAAAATLVGLLFVGLSLHIRVVVSQADVKSLARITLADFFVILLVACSWWSCCCWWSLSAIPGTCWSPSPTGRIARSGRASRVGRTS